MNFFLRLRISKQDKIAANVAQHIRAVRAAEALDRRTRLRRTDSFNFPGLGSMLPAQRSTSSGEDSPGVSHDKKRLVGMIKQAYAEEVPEEVDAQVEDVACQTSYDLLEALLPSLRKRRSRSEIPDEDDVKYGNSHITTPSKSGVCQHKHPLFGDSCRHYTSCDSSHSTTGYDNVNFISKANGRSRSRNRHADDRVEVEYKMQEEADLMDYDVEEVISLKEMKRAKALQLLGKKSQYNKLQVASGDASSLGLPQEGVSEASFSPTVSQDSLIDATSSIVEESASTGSDDTPGSAVYKNIIINLGGNQDRSGRGFLSAPHSSTTSAANLNFLPIISDRTSLSQEDLNDKERRYSPDVVKWHSPNGNTRGVSLKSSDFRDSR